VLCRPAHPNKLA